MPGFEADDQQEVSSPYSYVNRPSPAAALSSNFNAGYGGGYQTDTLGSGGNANPIGYSGGNPDTSVTSSGTPSSNGVSRSDSGASRSMVDSVSGSGSSSDAISGGGSADSLGAPTLPTYPSHIIDEQTGMEIRLPQTKAEVRRAQSQFRDLGYPIRVDGRMGPQTKGVITQFQTDWNADPAHKNDQITIDGYLGIAPPGVAQTGPRLDAAHANMLANRSGYVGAGQQPVGAYVPPAPIAIVSPLAAAAPPSPRARPTVSPLEAARLPTVSPSGKWSQPPATVDAGTRGVVDTGGPAGGVVGANRPSRPADVSVTPGGVDHAAAIKEIIAPFSVGAGKMSGAGLQYAQAEAGPDYGKRSADARRGPVRINQGPELTGGGPAAAPAAIAAEPPPVSSPGYPREPNMTATRNERTGTPGRVPTNPIQPGATIVSSLEVAHPVPPAGASRYDSELQKLREQYGLKPADNVGPGEAPSAPPIMVPGGGQDPANLLATLKADNYSGYDPGPAAEGIRPPGAPPVSGLEQAAQAARSGLGAGAPAEANTPPATSTIDRVLGILGLTPPSPPQTPSPELSAIGQKPNYPAATGTPAPKENWVDPAYGSITQGEPDAHAAALKQVTDMMANQPPEKQQAVADHMVIFAHAASLVAAAPPEQRAAAFDEQLTRLKSMGAIDDATEKKLRGTTPSDAQLNQMIELGKAVHDMGIGRPQSSLENARPMGVASIPQDGAGEVPARGGQVAAAGYSDNPYGIQGNVDPHGLPYQAEPTKIPISVKAGTYGDFPDAVYMDRQQFDRAFPNVSPDQRDGIWNYGVNWYRATGRDTNPEGGTPTSSLENARGVQVASADGGDYPNYTRSVSNPGIARDRARPDPRRPPGFLNPDGDVPATLSEHPSRFWDTHQYYTPSRSPNDVNPTYERMWQQEDRSFAPVVDKSGPSGQQMASADENFTPVRSGRITNSGSQSGSFGIAPDDPRTMYANGQRDIPPEDKDSSGKVRDLPTRFYKKTPTRSDAKRRRA